MTQDLPPIRWEPLRFIPVPDVRELPPLLGWRLWDEAVEQMEAQQSTHGRAA